MDKSKETRFTDSMRDFLDLCMKELGLDKLPKIEWVTGHRGIEDRTFGRFVNETETIHVVIRNRHPLDIMRTLAHELVHYKQFLDGRLGPESGKTGSREENQAHARAGIIMRHYDHAYPHVFTSEPVNEDNRRVRAIEPKTLDAIYNIQNYGRQVKAVKKQADAELSKERRAAKQADAEKRRETDPEFKSYIRVYMLPVAVKAIRYWRESKNVEWIQKVARSWSFAKKGWPKEVLDDIYNDPEWKASVVRVFEIADNLLKLKEIPPSNRGRSTGRLALDRLGEDPQEAVDVYNTLTKVAKKVLAKHNIDKHGLRLPPKS